MVAYCLPSQNCSVRKFSIGPTDDGKGLVFVPLHQSIHFPQADEYDFSVPLLHAAERILKDSSEMSLTWTLALKLCRRLEVGCSVLLVDVCPPLGW